MTRLRRVAVEKEDEPFKTILFYVNGERVVLENPDPTVLLANYLRENLKLTGTKVSCGEGGCGACTVVLGTYNGRTGQVSFAPVNACLRPLCSIDGCAIITVEGMGNVKDGMNPIQQKLADFNGTQCGYCTPGWVSSMYGLMLQKGGSGQLTEEQIEGHFDGGNLCRCTGYRPILEAFKTFANTTKDEDIKSTNRAALPRPGSPSCSPSTSSCGSTEVSDDDLEGEEDDWVKVDNPVVATRVHGQPQATHSKCSGGQGKGACGGQGMGTCSNRLSRVVDMEDLCCRGSVTHKRWDSKSKKASPPLIMDAKDVFPAELRGYKPQGLRIKDEVTGSLWYRVLTLPQLLGLMRDHHDVAVQLVVGNTTMGVSKYFNGTAPYNKPDEYSVLIDVSRLPELTSTTIDSAQGQLTVGASVTLNSLIDLLDKAKGPSPPSFPHGQSVLAMVHRHLKLVAHEQVRNVGSWAGNLMLFKTHRDFPSDVNIAFTAADARLSVADVATGSISIISMEEFWHLDFVARPFVIISVTLQERTPSAGGEVVAKSFRVAQRSRNSHAHTNAGFVAEVIPKDNGPPVCVKPCVVFSGVAKTAFRASRCEQALDGQPLTSTTLASSLVALEEDLTRAGPNTTWGGQQFRKKLMQSFLYMYVMTCQGPSLAPELVSAVEYVERPVSKSTQVFTPDPGEAPVSMPIPKIEAPVQCTGEAVYTNDEPMPPGSLHGAFVFSTKALARVVAINTQDALQLPGVVDILTAADVRGHNDITFGTNDEMFLVPIQGVVECVGMPIAVVLALTPEQARQAARQVAVKYEPVVDANTGEVARPIITLEDAIAAKSFFPGIADFRDLTKGDVDVALSTAPHTLSGRLDLGGQKHFYFEPQVSLGLPQEDGSIVLTASTQAPSDTQSIIAKVLGVPKHQVTVQMRRGGGGFGAKFSRSLHNAVAAAMGVAKTRRAVRVSNDRTTDFAMIGGREPLIVDYEVGFDDEGKVTGLKMQLFMDGGAAVDGTFGDMDMAMLWADNVYYFPNYHAEAYCCKTNTAITTSMRAPGVVQSCQAVELVMEHVARALGKPFQEVQEANFLKDGDVTPYGQTLKNVTLPEVWGALKESAQVKDKQAEVAAFNKSNRWKKRGVGVTAAKYGISHGGIKASASVKVFQEDGTMLLNHSGCEIGQGLNTKVAQAVAYELGVPLDMIRTTPTTTEKIPNATGTGGSSTSETTVQAALNACKELKDRLAPYRAQLGQGATWKELIKAAADGGVCLSCEGWYAPPLGGGDDVFLYYVYTAAVTVAELNVLTGEEVLLSSDIIYDCGESLSPLVDIGQIEGAFVMGIGYYLTEEVVYGADGQLLSNGTWDYKPPSAFDIPLDFKVTLLPNLPNPKGVLRSKATGEPPYIIANSAYFAVKEALYAARNDIGLSENFDLPIPAVVGARLEATGVHSGHFVL